MRHEHPDNPTVAMLFGNDDLWREPAVMTAATLATDGVELVEPALNESYLFESTEARCWVSKVLADDY